MHNVKICFKGKKTSLNQKRTDHRVQLFAILPQSGFLDENSLFDPPRIFRSKMHF
jgi:hypothetical protein